MILSNEDKVKLNYFAAGQGEETLEYLATKLYEFYAHEAVICDGNEVLRHQGAARLAKWLKNLPKGLRNGNGTGDTVG